MLFVRRLAFVLLSSFGIPHSSFSTELTFPKLTDATRIRGELVSADFVHRSGQIRTEKGELMDFTMPPYAIMKHRGAESDLRDVPLGTKMDFLMLLGGKLLTTDDQQADLAVGDVLLANFTAELPGSPSSCTDIWIGEDTHKLVSEARQKKLKSAKPAKAAK